MTSTTHTAPPGQPLTAARGHFVHVYVDRATRRPVELPASLKEALAALPAVQKQAEKIRLDALGSLQNERQQNRFNAISRGYFTSPMAHGIEQVLGREEIRKEWLIAPLEMEVSPT